MATPRKSNPLLTRFENPIRGLPLVALARFEFPSQLRVSGIDANRICQVLTPQVIRPYGGGRRALHERDAHPQPQQGPDLSRFVSGLSRGVTWLILAAIRGIQAENSIILRLRGRVGPLGC